MNKVDFYYYKYCFLLLQVINTNFKGTQCMNGDHDDNEAENIRV